MADNKIYYKLKAVHTECNSIKKETNIYERKLNIEVLEQFESIIYNRDLKMHFEDKAKSGCIYEIETDNIQLSLCPRLKKAEDFIRRTNYLYDWIQGDYTGEEVEEYLKEVDQCLQSKENILKATLQYFHFSLLFPQIPIQHNSKWDRKRIIEFSGYEKEQFEEIISFEKVENGMRQYRITGTTLPDNKIKINKYDGIIYCKVNN
jgi:hypothetical protein